MFRRPAIQSSVIVVSPHNRWAILTFSRSPLRRPASCSDPVTTLRLRLRRTTAQRAAPFDQRPVQLTNSPSMEEYGRLGVLSKTMRIIAILASRFVTLSIGFCLLPTLNAALIVYDGSDYEVGQSLEGNGYRRVFELMTSEGV
jgi:hypothetical protein